MKIGCFLADILFKLDLTAFHEQIQGIRAVTLKAAAGRQFPLQQNVILGAVATTAMQLLVNKETN